MIAAGFLVYEKFQCLDVCLQFSKSEDILAFLKNFDKKLLALEKTGILYLEKESARWINKSAHLADTPFRFYFRLKAQRKDIVFGKDRITFPTAEAREAFQTLISSSSNKQTITFSTTDESSTEKTSFVLNCFPSMMDPIALLVAKAEEKKTLITEFLDCFKLPDADNEVTEQVSTLQMAKKTNQEIVEHIRNNPELMPDFYYFTKKYQAFHDGISKSNLTSPFTRANRDDLAHFKNNLLFNSLQNKYANSNGNLICNPLFLSSTPELFYGKLAAAVSESALLLNTFSDGSVEPSNDIVLLAAHQGDSDLYHGTEIPELCGRIWLTKTQILYPFTYVVTFVDPNSEDYQDFLQLFNGKAKILCLHPSCIDMEKWHQYIRNRNEKQAFFPFSSLESQTNPLSTYDGRNLSNVVLFPKPESQSSLHTFIYSPIQDDNNTVFSALTIDQIFNQIIQNVDEFISNDGENYQNYENTIQALLESDAWQSAFNNTSIENTYVNINAILVRFCSKIFHSANINVINGLENLTQLFLRAISTSSPEPMKNLVLPYWQQLFHERKGDDIFYTDELDKGSQWLPDMLRKLETTHHYHV